MDEKQFESLDEFNQAVADARFLTDRDKRKIGVNAKTGELVAEGAVAATGQFLKDKFTGDFNRDDLTGASGLGRFAADAFEITAGKGIETIQNLGLSTQQPLVDLELERDEEQLRSLQETNFDILRKINAETNPKKKQEFEALLDQNTRLLNKRRGESERFKDSFGLDTKEALGDTVAGATGVGLLKTGGLAATGGIGLLKAGAIEAGLSGVNEGAIQVSNDEDINAVTVGLATGVGFAFPFGAAAAGSIARSVSKLLPTKKNALDKSVDELSRDLQLKGDEIVSSKDIPTSTTTRLDDAIDRLSIGDESANFRDAVRATLQSIDNRADFNKFVTSLSNSLKAGDVSLLNQTIREIRDGQVSKVQAQELVSIREQIADLESTLKDVSPSSKTRTELQQTIDAIEAVPATSRSQAQRNALRAAKDDLDNVADDKAVEALKARITKFKELESGLLSTGASSGARVKGGVVSAADNDLLDDQLDNIVLENQFDANGNLNKEAFNTRNDRTKKLSFERTNSKAQRNKVSQGIRDILTDTDRVLADRYARVNSLVDSSENVLTGVSDFMSRTALKKGKVRYHNNIDLAKRRDNLESLNAIAKRMGVKRSEIKKDMDDLLTATHARDVNRVKGTTAKGNPFIMTDATADAIISTVKNKYAADYIAFDTIRASVVQHNKDKLGSLADAGLITRDLAKELNELYPNYVPTIRDIDGKPGDIVFADNNIDDTIRELKGSEAGIKSSFDASYDKGMTINTSIEENRTRKALGIHLINEIKSGNKSINQLVTVRASNKKFLGEGDNGVIFFDADNNAFRITSKDKKLLKAFDMPGDPQGLELAYKRITSISGLYVNMSRFFLTRSNPGFQVASAVRDPLEGLAVAINLGMSELGAHKALTNIARYSAAIADNARGVKNDATDLIERGNRLGLSFSSLSNQTEGFEKIRYNIPWFDRGLRHVELLSEQMESAARYSFFKQALDEGFDELQAANLAKEAMLNFDKEGEITKYMKPLYLFFNATMLGNKNFLRVMSDPKTATETIVATSAASYGQEGYNSMYDPEWRNYFTDHELSSNLIIVIGKETNPDGTTKGMQGFKVPLPISLRGMWAAENAAIQVAKGQKNAGRAALEALQTQVNILSPTGNRAVSDGGTDPSLLSFILPSAAQPINRVRENENFFGNTIVRESFESTDEEFIAADIPESFGDGVDEKVSLALSNLIRKASEGKGKWSDPRAINELMAGFFYMGSIKDAEKAVRLINDIGESDEVNAHEVPVFNRFYTETRADLQWVRDQDQLIDNALLAESPQEVRDLLFRQTLYDTTDTYLGGYKSTVLKEAGVEDIPKEITYGFKNDLRSLNYASFMLDILRDEAHPDHEQLQHRLGVMRRLKPNDYKNFVEYQAAEAGLLNGGREDIKQFFSERGVELKSVPRSSMEKKYYALRRRLDNEGEVVYNIQEEINDKLRLGQTVPIEELIQAVEQNRALIDRDLLDTDIQLKREEILYQNYTKTFSNNLIRAYNSEEITLQQMINEAKGSNIPGVKKAIVDYAVEKGLIRI